jgi:hypothetical protein
MFASAAGGKSTTRSPSAVLSFRWPLLWFTSSIIDTIVTCVVVRFMAERSARAKQVSTARMSPGAPSVTASSGSARPQRLRSSKNAVQLAVSSFVSDARCSSPLRPSSVEGGQPPIGDQRWTSTGLPRFEGRTPPAPCCRALASRGGDHVEAAVQSIPPAGCTAPAGYVPSGTRSAAHASRIGSTMRQDSSASSPRMESVGSPSRMSRIRRA